MSDLSIEQFVPDKCESLYQLVLAAAKRATQLSKSDRRPLVQSKSKKPTIVALEEILHDKVRVLNGHEEDEPLPE